MKVETFEMTTLVPDERVARAYIEEDPEWTVFYWTDKKEHGDRKSYLPTAIVRALRRQGE